jgi:hypothetical protein
MTAIGAAAFAAILGMAGPAGTRVAVAQQPTCLHGDNETPEQLARRKQALGFTRHVNTLEATGAAANAGVYQPPARLGITQSLPSGFQLRLSTSGSSYAYSVIDTTDPCRFAYFSDENGVIFRGEAIRGGRD